jgi:uncharacterized protein YbjQ (UPF0145 family)
VSKICLKCDYKRQPTDLGPEWQCPNCEAVYTKIEQAVKQGVDVQSKQRPLTKQDVADKLSKMVATTTPTLPAAEICKVLGIVAGDSTHAFSSMSEFFGSIGRTFAGSGKSHGTESHLMTCRQEAIRLLEVNAAQLGADAIIGVSVEVTEFSGATDNGVVVISATGTAVTTMAKSK